MRAPDKRYNDLNNRSVVFPIPSGSNYDIGEGFGAPRPYRKGTHMGMDFHAPIGTDTLAPFDGEVVKVVNGFKGRRDASSKNYTGNMVLIRGKHPTLGMITVRYMHLKDTNDLHVGDHVKAGDVVGHIGVTGTMNSLPHLHADAFNANYSAEQNNRAGNYVPMEAILGMKMNGNIPKQYAKYFKDNSTALAYANPATAKSDDPFSKILVDPDTKPSNTKSDTDKKFTGEVDPAKVPIPLDRPKNDAKKDDKSAKKTEVAAAATPEEKLKPAPKGKLLKRKKKIAAATPDKNTKQKTEQAADATPEKTADKKPEKAANKNADNFFRVTPKTELNRLVREANYILKGEDGFADKDNFNRTRKREFQQAISDATGLRKGLNDGMIGKKTVEAAREFLKLNKAHEADANAGKNTVVVDKNNNRPNTSA